MKPFNPLDKKNLAMSVAKELLARPLEALPTQPFIGAGVYAIYYTGKHRPYPLYQSIAVNNPYDQDAEPIYVGKAMPPGARTGGFGLDTNPGAALFHRLREHAMSIQQAKNLSLDDFLCRYLIVDDIWIPLAEALLIDMFAPVWNTVIPGFGNHDPGRGRHKQQRSSWDTLHPGRPWAAMLQPNAKSAAEIESSARQELLRRRSNAGSALLSAQEQTDLEG